MTDHSKLHALSQTWPSVNALTAPLVASLMEQAAALRLGVERVANGCTIVDAGIHCLGGLEAGRRVAQICMGGLGVVDFARGTCKWPIQICVHAANPVLSCLGTQYAGWSLAHGEGKGSFRALGSGPGRALAQKEDLFAELGYRDRAEATSLVLEVDKLPPPEIIAKISRDCAVAPEKIVLILTPTRSLAGVVQIVARVLEVALHKAHTLQFPLEDIVDGFGIAPVPPPAKDFVTGIGGTNDAILYGGLVQLYVDCEDGAANDLAQALPSSNSRDYGRSFAQVFKDYNYDFYKIDPMLFAPAAVTVSNMKTGRSFHGGRINEELIDRSFAGGG